MHKLLNLYSGQNGKAEAGTAYEIGREKSLDSQRNSNTLKRKLDQSDSGQMQDKACRTTYSAEQPLWTLPPSLQTEPKPDLSLIDEHNLPSTSPDQKQAPAINGYHNSGSFNFFNKISMGRGVLQDNGIFVRGAIIVGILVYNIIFYL